MFKDSSHILLSYSQVGSGSTVDTTDCRCTPSSDRKSFGVSFLSPPNLIDFRTVWAKFANIGDNAAVLSTVVVILVLYVLLAAWARWEDRRDMVMVRWRKYTFMKITFQGPLTFIFQVFSRRFKKVY